MTKKEPNFNAAPSAAGYFYQARLALLLALAKVNHGDDIEIAIEKLDDVSFEKSGSPIELLQTKHHIDQTASLTDSSPDIWKTLRVWSIAAEQDPSLPLKSQLILITTGTCPPGSAAGLLRSPNSYGAGEKRDPVQAAKILSTLAESAQNIELMKSYQAFLKLSEKMRISLLSAIVVIDSAKQLQELTPELEERLKFIAAKDKLSAAREALEGWWFAKVCQALVAFPTGTIPLTQLETKIEDIRESFKQNALTFDYEDSEPTDHEAAHYDTLPFVRQLHAIGVGGNRVAFAKRDYYRAFNQRSTWSRTHAVLDEDLAKYERTLVEEWQPKFEIMVDGLGEAEEGEVRQAGNQIYQWVETEARFPLRNVSTRSLCVGSYHILSNQLRVGWHRDFAKLFKEGDA